MTSPIELVNKRPLVIEFVRTLVSVAASLLVKHRGFFFFLKVTGRGENPPPEFHSLALEWPIKWVKKFYSILILWLHCGFKGSTPGHANSKITLR